MGGRIDGWTDRQADTQTRLYACMQVSCIPQKYSEVVTVAGKGLENGCICVRVPTGYMNDVGPEEYACDLGILAKG